MRAAALLLALLAAGCVAGDTDEPDGSPRRDLAARPQSLPPAASSATAGPASGTPGAPSGSVRPGTPGGSLPPTAGSAAPSGGTTSPTGAPSGPGAPAAPFHQVGTTSDRAGDAGSVTPAYGDITAVTIEDDGTNARVTVRMAGTLPARVASNETMGIGVDLYRTAAQLESDYQLFADGQPDGWYAYLHTPKGFVRYQGTFGIGGDRLVFTVPWSALGGPSAGTFSGFADWTRTASPVNQSGEDRAPGLGNASYRR